MRKLLAILFVLGGFAGIQSCSGPMGPPGLPGPQGAQGQPGINILAEVFEVENVNFTSANEFREVFEFTRAIEPSDKIASFILWQIDNGVDIWRPLPQTVFLPSGIMLYNFDFTRFDFSFFLEANFPLNQAPTDFTRNQIFRIVVIPADFTNARLDFSDYNALMEFIGKTEEDVVKLNK
ncbi:hypothetical protein [Mongoliitalea lutea]|uniref:Collagen-like protein n=1 Tax=Mongoliitalea lutea TaxID=849756 RepID=A0A8J3G5G9_9BACT|nr:hypothetical protein [Mongoliitalea lutea]GHB35839.1 hypothetical protein GCM10008106_16670 [Mongoliitalea lutea]